MDLVSHLISSALRRCSLSDDLCRLSLVLRISSASESPNLQISISDTGIGSSTEEFRGLKVSSEALRARGWDGLICVTTTGVSDKEIYSFSVNLKECSSGRKLNKLASKSKNGVKFSGTEVCLSVAESPDFLVGEIKRFFQKMMVLNIRNVVIELVAEREGPPLSRDEYLFLANECNPLPFSASHLERLKSGLEEYALKHGNSISKQCLSCFPSLEYLKVGSGMACSSASRRKAGLVMEVVIIISKIAAINTSCLRASSAKTEVLYFRDFLSCSISESSFKALKSIDWKSYGLNLASVESQGDNVFLEWENLPIDTHIDIALHLYTDQVMRPSTRLKTQVDHNLTKKAVKLALEDLRDKYSGVFLSAHAVKIQSYAPDLAKTISGLIMSSEDSHFQRECFSLLGLQSCDIGDEIVEACIAEKINFAIEINDKKPQRGKEVAPFLFEDEYFQEQADFEDEEFGSEDGFSPMDM